MIEIPGEAELRIRSGRKWQLYAPHVLPAWIADMDIMPAPSILAAIEEGLRCGDFGYGPAGKDSGVPEAFAAWAMRRWQWSIQPGDVMLAPDVVGEIANCIEALTQPGEAVMVHLPAYPPLFNTIMKTGRRLVTAPLNYGRIDFDTLESRVKREHVRLLLFCHPQNPTGHVYTTEDLQALAALCERCNLIVVSDEVHADLTYTEHTHIPFAVFAPERTITLNAPSKAFNVAGLRTAVCVASPSLRERLEALPPTRWSAFSTFGLRAARAAWSDDGALWLEACVTHLHAMRHMLADRLKTCCPAISYTPPAAGYLAWLDCRSLGLDNPAAFFLEKANVALSAGPDFGAPGAGFARLNFATSEEILNRILSRMACALRER